jgi:uncharacterized membrane protein
MAVGVTQKSTARPLPSRLRRPLVAIPLFLVGLALAIGLATDSAGSSWRWTGFQNNNHLWDWMHLLLLPTVLTVLPLWRARQRRRHRAERSLLAVATLVFLLVVFCGYLVPWAWTGFTGNTLWDWLNLLALPVSLALLPLWLGREHIHGWEKPALLVLGIAFTVITICGYAVPWHWTGFVDNTLWDWLQMLLVPFAIPAAVVILTNRQ